jgi:hypothetical protein
MEQSHYNHHGPYGQPGLEAVGSNQPDLEVATHEHVRHGHSLPEVVTTHEHLQHGHSLPEALHGHPIYVGTEKNAAPAYSAAYPAHYTPVPRYPPYEAADLAATQQKPRRKWLWVAIGLLAAVIILGAVLGGVLGSRAANSSSGDEAAGQTGGDSGESAGAGASSTATGDAPSPTTTNPPPPIRQGSALSATGWRRPDGSVETFLFYQDPQDGLRYSRCDTNDRSQGNESTGWGPPISVGGDFVKPGTRLGGTTFVYGDRHKVSLA